MQQIVMFEFVSRKEERMVGLNRSDHFSKQMVSSPVWWCISGEHQRWGYSPFYRLPRHDHLSGGKMEKLNLSVSLRLTTQRGIFLQNHFLRPTYIHSHTLPPINITVIFYWIQACTVYEIQIQISCILILVKPIFHNLIWYLLSPPPWWGVVGWLWWRWVGDIL